jgi:hypothetical protein
MHRRTLHFGCYGDVLREADSLLAAGYERAGSWSLGQMGHHLAVVVEMSIDGFPTRPYAWPVRKVMRWLFLGRIQRHAVFRRRIPAPTFILPPDAADDRAGLERLRRATERFEAWGGPMQPSPVFGPLTAAEWRELHLWHCEHHLSFLHPRSGAP